ncbi:MAG: methyltransferase domain-containing protein [Rudaea sp.]
MVSRTVTSRQSAPHPRLAEIVSRHLESTYRRSPGAHGRDAFARVADRLAAANGEFVLDAGCGTGASTFALACRFPRRFVLGVDKSAARLAVGTRTIDRGAAPDNAALLRCDLVDFWQLAAAAQLRCHTQFVLYPNPWPKPEHVMRRWHAHPVLTTMLSLGGEFELRTNWQVYAAEFAQALRHAGREAKLEKLEAVDPLTPFERKYAAAGQALWRCLVFA